MPCELRRAAAQAAAVPLLTLLVVAMVACGKSEKKPAVAPTQVIVVGAGMAGLTAARALTAAEIPGVVIEARDRIGGRTHTANVDGATVDLGGAWIHGPNGNPLSAMAKALGVSHRTTDDLAPDAIIYDSELGHLSDEVSGAAWLAAAAFEEWDAPDGLSLTQAADAYVDAIGLTGVQRRLTRYFIVELGGELDVAGPGDLMSLAGMQSGEAFSGGDHVLDGGYASIVKPLANGLDIRLSQPVTRISYDDAGVVVHTATGQTHRGSHVIVTVPLGVLKARRIAFEPELPAAKLQAIDRLDMSSLEKVVLRFDEHFWGDGFATISSATPGEFPACMDLTRAAGAPTLACLYGGAFSRKTQTTQTDAQIVARVLELMGKALERSIPAPRATVVTRWHSDPFSMGSYSYFKVGSTPQDMKTLAEPVNDRVLFAGEATIADYFQTVHGAVLSGAREAERLGAPRSGVPVL